MPEATCTKTYAFITKLYSTLTNKYPTKRIMPIGDSAGRGLALGFTQQLRNQGKKQPNQIILFSPWLDVTMNNPKQKLLEQKDKILSINGLRSAGQKYAGKLELTDFRVSPIYGDLTRLCQITIFTGTNDILNADAQKCKEIMKKQQLKLHYFEYPEMMHDWITPAQLKESEDSINKANTLINGNK